MSEIFQLQKAWFEQKGERMENKLWYERPAAVFTDALPFGNGSFGGMVYGGIAEDKITLNQDTLWSGTGTRQERQIHK